MMKTIIYTIDKDHIDMEKIREAGRILAMEDLWHFYRNSLRSGG